MRFLLASLVFAALFSASFACGNALHAHCQLNWNFADVQCSTLLQIFANQFRHCCLDSSIKADYTNYTLVSLDTQNLVVQGHITFNDGYIDDQTITLTQSGANCTAVACSVSESLSYYDYSANYCDSHNLARGIGYTFTETISECKFHPDQGQEDTYCNTQ